MPGTFGIDVPGSIGTVTTPVGSPVPTIDRWPSVVPAGFVHVDVPPASVRPELTANPTAFPGGLGQVISPALLDFFLPERKNFLLGQLNAKRCVCRNRFIFLPAAVRRRAIDIMARVDKEFVDRFESLERRILEARMSAEGEGPATRLLAEETSLVAERDGALTAELGRAGIRLPDAELSDLKPQAMKLRAGAAAKGDPKRASALRVAEINELLRKEPPRRTVTGSFRPH